MDTNTFHAILHAHIYLLGEQRDAVNNHENLWHFIFVNNGCFSSTLYHMRISFLSFASFVFIYKHPVIYNRKRQQTRALLCIWKSKICSVRNGKGECSSMAFPKPLRFKNKLITFTFHHSEQLELYGRTLRKELTRLTTKPTKWHVRPAKTDQPGHPPSLISVFAVCTKTAWVLSYPLSAQRRLWSDWTDAQADQSLRWAHRPHCWFCHEVAHMCYVCHTKTEGSKHWSETGFN